MSVNIIDMKIQYEAIGIDSSVRNTQRLLYAMNAVRLSIRDIQDVMAGPTLQNVMWTAIQLTRVWTTLWRLVQAVNKEQGIGKALGLVGGGGGGGGGVTGELMEDAFGGAAGSRIWGGAATSSLWATVMATLAIPGVGIAVGAAAATVGLVAWDISQRKIESDWVQRQRDTAKSQGLEW